MPRRARRFVPHPLGFANRRSSWFRAGADRQVQDPRRRLPEPHPDAADAAADVAWLKRKIDAGANHRRSPSSSSTPTPSSASAMPARRRGSPCRSSPASCRSQLGGCQEIRPPLRHEGSGEAGRGLHHRRPRRREELLALAQCTALCDRLIEGGVEDLHFYTLNRPILTREVVRALGIQPAGGAGKGGLRFNPSGLPVSPWAAFRPAPGRPGKPPFFSRCPPGDIG
jgi:methylenetetrahydrofolate reductase (NADPH)